VNNVAVGAAYARAKFAAAGSAIKRICIFDFDVHHGNGTEAIVRNLQPTTLKSKLDLPMGSMEVTQSTFKPWLDGTDGDNTMFVSLHGYGKWDPKASAKLDEARQAAESASSSSSSGQESKPLPGPWFYPGSGRLEGMERLGTGLDPARDGGMAPKAESKSAGIAGDDATSAAALPSEAPRVDGTGDLATSRSATVSSKAEATA